MTASRTTITDVEPLTGHWVRLTFVDGAIHEIDLADVLEAGGVFARPEAPALRVATAVALGAIAAIGTLLARGCNTLPRPPATVAVVVGLRLQSC